MTQLSIEQPPVSQLLTPQELRAEAHGTIEQLTATMFGAVELSPYDLRVLLGGVAVGSILMEGQPGTGKTLIAKTLAKAMGGVYQRIQGSPDVQPSDILGYEFWHPGKQELEFRPGAALRANVLFADELNRNPEKSQAAFLEVMEEHQVTVDGKTYNAQKPLTVLATQNPIEEPGTNPLPRAELDRFAVSLQTDQTPEVEAKVLSRYLRVASSESINPVGLDKISRLRLAVKTVALPTKEEELILAIKDQVTQYAAVNRKFSIVNGRAKLRMADVARFHTLARGENEAIVIAEDVEFAARAVLGHRLQMTYAAIRDGYTASNVVDDAIARVAA